MRQGFLGGFLLLLLVSVPRPALSQVLQGELVERGTAQPVQGALALLLDAVGESRAGTLTNSAGRFRLQAPGPGRYTVRLERIGYATADTVVTLEEGKSEGFLRLETVPLPLALEEIRVSGSQRCTLRPSEGMELARVWEEARKALSAQAWAERAGVYRFRLARWERERDPTTLEVRSENRRVWEAYHRNPMQSVAVEDLLASGFVRPDSAGGWVYYGPDARVLLSDPFLDTHCFRLKTDRNRPELLGLAFEPTDRSRPEVEGTLWLHRDSGRLSFLDFRYTWAPWPEAAGWATGRVDFRELPDGGWIVERWWIRMPLLTQRVGGFQGRSRWELTVTGLKEVGGEVLAISAPAKGGSGGVSYPP